MASKGPRNGAGSPKTRSLAPRPPEANAAAAPEAKVAEPEPVAKKPVPPAPQPTPVVPEAVKPAPAPVAAPVVEKTETAVAALARPVEAAVTETAEAAEAATVETVEAAKAAAESVSKEAPKMEATVDTAINKTQNYFADANARAKAALEKSTRLVEELNEFAKGNLEAFVESSRITAKGFESLSQEAADYGRRSFESATAALKNLAAVKSPTEFFKLQSDYVRSAFDSYVAEASKTTEAVLKLAGDAAQPLSNRVAVAAEKVKTVA